MDLEIEQENEYEKELDQIITEINTDGGMPVDAFQTVLGEFNTRMLTRILCRLDEIAELLKKD